MNTFTKILFASWIILAIACFVGAFYVTPVFFKVLGIVFGFENMLVILSWIIATVQGKKEYKLKKIEEEK